MNPPDSHNVFFKGIPLQQFFKGIPLQQFFKGIPHNRLEEESPGFLFLRLPAAGGGIPLKNTTDFGWRFSGGVLFLLPLPKGEGKDIYYDAIVIMGWDGR